MPEALYILTGASRGMGEAIARQLLKPGHLLLGISRSVNPALTGLAQAGGVELVQWPQDLAQAVPAAHKLEAWLAALDARRFASATLINNAGVVSEPGPLDQAQIEDLSNAMRVGLESCLLLTSVFLRATKQWTAQRKVLNISSGLGRRGMAGSASYCAAKAGMDNFSRAVALEEAALPNGARIVSLAPGVIDTDMQVQLRSTDLARFPDGALFRDLKTSGKLMSPDEAATRVLAYLARNDFGNNPLASVNDA
jgi:NAD(P)-dependent dehydrogenase (short-subunit alcohol dehydrogenase family)